MEVRLKIFYDDLQLSMGLTPGEELPKKYKGADDLILNFIKKNFIIYINGSKITYEYVKSESSPPAIWSTIRINNLSTKPSQLAIENTILIKEFQDQINIINIDVYNHKETYKLDKKKKRLDIKLNQN
jgi:hypothetical protein